jgi:hypothetical protein
MLSIGIALRAVIALVLLVGGLARVSTGWFDGS